VPLYVSPFSCGDRPVYVADSPGFYGSSRIRKQVRVGLGEALSVLVEDMVCRSPGVGDHGLRRSHRLGDPFLRLVGVAARLDDRGGDGELVSQRVMGRDKFPVLAQS
jgi:hypothetical protein